MAVPVRKKPTFFAITVAVLFIVSLAAIVFFTRALRQVPEIRVPDEGDIDVGIDTSINPVLNDRQQIESIRIGRDNVQNVVAALKRPEQYYLESTSTLYAGNMSADTKVNRWTREQRTRLVIVAPGTSRANNLIITKDKIYAWVEGSTSHTVSERGAFNPDDFAWMPTYEDVLELDAEEITDGGTEQIAEGFCIYVQTGDPALGYSDRYWILSDSGLLVRAESYLDGTLVYSMRVRYSSQASLDGGMFTLPSGDTVGGT